jgi:hypothetical protein
MPNINIPKLSYELANAGLPVVSVSGVGSPVDAMREIWTDASIELSSSATPAQITQANTIKSVHSTSTPFQVYAKAFVNNAALWVKLHKSLDDDRSTFDISTATGATILAKLREQLKGVRDVIANAPQGVIDEFHRERVLQGSTTANPLNDAAIDAMTAAECRICISVARLVANQGLAIVTAAYSLNE